MNRLEFVLFIKRKSDRDLLALRIGADGLLDLGPVEPGEAAGILLQENPDLALVSCPGGQGSRELTESLSRAAGKAGIPLLLIIAGESSDPWDEEMTGLDPFKLYESALSLLGSLSRGRSNRSREKEVISDAPRALKEGTVLDWQC